MQDVKIHLTAKSVKATIDEATNEPVGEADKATAMIFLEGICTMHCRLNTLQKKIHTHSSSL